jgi:hypothetical protein
MLTVAVPRMRKHYYGIALCSVAVVVLFYVVTSIGWDFGDHVTGDAVQPGHHFSRVERVCFYTSRIMTIPLRWMHPSDSFLGIIALLIILMLWGLLTYALVYGLLHVIRTHGRFRTKGPNQAIQRTAGRSDV